MKVKVADSCPTICNFMDYTVHGILQARTLEWVAVLFSRGSSQPRDQTWSPTLQADSLPSESPGKPQHFRKHCQFWTHVAGLCNFLFQYETSVLGWSRTYLKYCFTAQFKKHFFHCTWGLQKFKSEKIS